MVLYAEGNSGPHSTKGRDASTICRLDKSLQCGTKSSSMRDCCVNFPICTVPLPTPFLTHLSSLQTSDIPDTMTTIVFVPGAWISKAFYKPFLQALTSAGYDVHYADYPSFDPKDPSTTDCHADTEAIRAILNPLVDEGKDVLLFLHSYGGMPGAAAATGLAKMQRAQEGKLGGVIGLLFLGAFVVPEGLSCAGLLGGNLPPWILLDQV